MTKIDASLEEILATPVEIGNTEWSIFENTITFSNIVIQDPPEFSEGNAYEIKQIRVSLLTKNLFADPLLIKSIAIDGLTLFYKADLGQPNVSILLNNHKKHLETSKNKQQRRWNITEIYFENSKIIAELIDEVREIPMNGTLVLYNSSEQGDVLFSDLIGALLKFSEAHIAEAGLNEVSSQIRLRLNALKTRHQDVLKVLTRNLQEGSRNLKELFLREAERIGKEIHIEFKHLEQLLNEFLQHEKNDISKPGEQ